LTVILREVSRASNSKAKVVFSLRLEEDDVEFLRLQPNASEFIRLAINEEKRKQRMLGSKNVPFEAIHEIAEQFTKNTIERFYEDLGNWNLQTHTEHLSSPLFKIAQLTLKCPNPFHETEEPIAPIYELETLRDELQSKEAKAFIQTIRDKIEDSSNSVNAYELKPLTEDEIETVRKIYDEAKMLLEQGYRKAFHKLPPADWHLTIYDGRNNGRLRYKLP